MRDEALACLVTADPNRAFSFPLRPIAIVYRHMNPMRQDLEEVLLTEEQIHHRLNELAMEIQRDYAEKDLTLVAILTGSVMFIADLLRRLPMQLRLDYIGVSSYHGETRFDGRVYPDKALKLDVRDRDVLVVDDILDTGLTLVNIRAMLQKLQPRSVKFCTFLEKDVPHRGKFSRGLCRLSYSQQVCCRLWA